MSLGTSAPRAHCIEQLPASSATGRPGRPAERPCCSCVAEALHSSLTQRGYTVWLDVKMPDPSAAAMHHGVENSIVALALVNGPCINPDRPDDDPASNALFRREYCCGELRAARAAGTAIQPVIRIEDKQGIGWPLQCGTANRLARDRCRHPNVVH